MKMKKLLLSGMALLASTAVAASVAFTVTSCSNNNSTDKNPTNPSTSVKYYLENNLFKFSKFLENNENNAKAILDKQTDYDEAKANASVAAPKIMNYFKTQLINSFSLDSTQINSIVAEQVGGNDAFHYNLSFTLNKDSDKLCQSIYNKDFQTIVYEISASDDYKSLSSTNAHINSIKLVFDFNFSKALNNNTLISFVLNQKAIFTFDNNTTAERDVINQNTTRKLTKDTNAPLNYFVQFDKNNQGEDGDLVNLSAIKFSADQTSHLLQIVNEDLSTWTKSDAINRGSDYPKAVQLKDKVNKFFKDNKLNLEVTQIVFDDRLYYGRNNLVCIMPKFYFNKYQPIEFEKDDFFAEISNKDNLIQYIGLNVTDNGTNGAINAKYDTLDLSNGKITEFARILESCSSEFKTKLGNGPEFIKLPVYTELMDKLNVFVQKNSNNLLKVESLNVWGGRDKSYKTNPKTGKITIDLGVFIVSKIDTNSIFARIIIPSNNNTSIILDDYNKDWNVIVYEELATGIPSALVLGKDEATNINNILKTIASKINTELTNEEIKAAFPEEVEAINTELKKINPKLVLESFNVWGNWNGTSEPYSPEGDRMCQLGIKVNTNDIECSGMIVDTDASDLLFYNQQYTAIVPKKGYKTALKKAFIMNEAIAKQINTLLEKLAAKISRQLSAAEIKNEFPDDVAAINQELNKINSKLSFKSFNIWGGTYTDSTEGYKTCKLAIVTNIDEFPDYENIVDKSNLFIYDANYKAIVPNTPYKTNIR